MNGSLILLFMLLNGAAMPSHEMGFFRVANGADSLVWADAHFCARLSSRTGDSSSVDRMSVEFSLRFGGESCSQAIWFEVDERAIPYAPEIMSAIAASISNLKNETCPEKIHVTTLSVEHRLTTATARFAGCQSGRFKLERTEMGWEVTEVLGPELGID